MKYVPLTLLFVLFIGDSKHTVSQDTVTPPVPPPTERADRILVTEMEAVESFLATDAVILRQEDGTVRVFTTEPQEATLTLKVVVENPEVTWIKVHELHPEGYLFPGVTVKEEAEADGHFFHPIKESTRYHVVVSNGYLPPEELTYEPPTPPVPELVEELVSLSATRADALNDNETRLRLKAALGGLLAEEAPSSRDAARGLLVKTIDDVMGERRGESEDADWEKVWRDPVSDFIKQYPNNEEVEVWLVLVRSMHAGL